MNAECPIPIIMEMNRRVFTGNRLLYHSVFNLYKSLGSRLLPWYNSYSSKRQSSFPL